MLGLDGVNYLENEKQLENRILCLKGMLTRQILKHNIAVEISADPASQFHPDIAAQFVEVPKEVRAGWVLSDDGTWSAPVIEAAPDAAAARPSVSPVEFKLLWPSPERIALRRMRDTNPVIADFWEIVEDPRVQSVNLDLKSTQQGIAYSLHQLADDGVIEAADIETRVEQILSGIVL